MTTLADIAKAQSDYDNAVAQVPIFLAQLNAAKAAYVPESTITFAIIDEVGLSADEMKTTLIGAQPYIQDVANHYGKGKVNVVIGMVEGAWPAYITRRKAIGGDAGYHLVENGVPTIYVQPGTAYSRFGYYHPAIAERKRLGIVTTKAVPEMLTIGMFGALLHELAETLIDPQCNLYSKPDSKGRKWKMEIGDHVFKSDWMQVINGIKCVFPNYTLPAEYELNSQGPWDKKGVLKGPFSMTEAGYGKDSSGQIIKFS